MISAYKHGHSTPFIKNVMVATSIKQRMLGLLNHQTLADDSALWIKPCNYIHTFFMHFAIDVLFLDAQHTVLAMHESLQPFRISRRISGASSVLEMSVGIIAQHKLSVGDQIDLTEQL